MRWGLLSFALIASGPAFACVCGGWPSAKSAWQESPVVFLGHVERVSPERRGSQRVWVRVDEAFKGSSAEQVFVLDQPADDCAPEFSEGEQVVLYLHHAAGKLWEAFGCHRSRTIERAADDLLFLRALPGSAEGNRLSGDVVQIAVKEHRMDERPVPGIPVTVHGPGGQTYHLVTNASGVYELYNLPPGEYWATIELPRNLKYCFPLVTGPNHLDAKHANVTLGSKSGESFGFAVVDARGSMAACVH